MFVVGKILGLGPLAEQFRLATDQGHGALEDLGRIGGAILGHVGATEEVQAFGGIRLGGGGAFQTLGHVLQGHWRLGEFAGQFHLVAGTKVQVQAQAQHRHQKRGQQRQRFTQTRFAGGFHTFGVGQQFAGGFGAAGVKLRGVEHAFGLLGLQFGHALLVERHIQCGAILLALGTAAT